MTTTLRPAEPEQQRAGGGRSRRFTICVNSRPVGTIHLATDPRYGPEVGRILTLDVDEPDRRRGRATVAALAAEEVLRGWRCRRVEVSVPADARHALWLATALGYTERNRAMEKTLTGAPPALPGDSAARPMDEADYAAWHAWERAAYVQGWVDRGIARARVEAFTEADYRRALPDGPATAGTALRVLSHGAADVGWLWVRLRDPYDAGAPAWVFSVDVAEEHRGRGHGRTLMLLAERECLAAGVRTVGLNVFTGNTPALRLYESLGYTPVQHHLLKTLL